MQGRDIGIASLNRNRAWLSLETVFSKILQTVQFRIFGGGCSAAAAVAAVLLVLLVLLACCCPRVALP